MISAHPSQNIRSWRERDGENFAMLNNSELKLLGTHHDTPNDMTRHEDMAVQETVRWSCERYRGEGNNRWRREARDM